MRPDLFKALDPLCPACGTGALSVREVLREDEHGIGEGLIECAEATCRHLYPVIDGIPVLVADLRGLVGDQLLGILAREDLHETTLGLLGECAGPGSTYDARRQHLSTYAHAHWEDLAPDGTGAPPAVVQLLDRGLAALAPPAADARPGAGPPAGMAPGPVLDLGCSLGRTTAHLAQRSGGGPVLGVDLSFAMLRVARRAVLGGDVRYARRRWGLVYEERRFMVPALAEHPVDFWCADVARLPLRPGTAATVTSLNLLDCLADPLEHLRSLARVLRPGGGAVLSTPYDWNPAATDPGAWVGGHSPYGDGGGAPDAVLRSLLDGSHPAAVTALEIVAEADDLGWDVRLHERATMRYGVHLLALRRRAG